MACGDEDGVVCLDEVVLPCLDNNYKDDFGVDFLCAHPLEYIFEETFGGKCLVHCGYMQKIGWWDTYVNFFYHHNYKNQMIYHNFLDDER